jgi:hypothetical protein
MGEGLTESFPPRLFDSQWASQGSNKMILSSVMFGNPNFTHPPAPPEVYAQLVWEASARVVIDFTPGAGGLAKSCLMMSVKTILVCHNASHIKALKAVLRKFIILDFEAQTDITLSKYAHADMQANLDEVKPVRLKMFETQKKRGLDDSDKSSPVAKRAALAENLENMLANFDSPAKANANAKAKAKGAAAPAPAPPAKEVAPVLAIPAVPAPTPKATAPVTGPATDLAELLQKWA